MRNSTLLALLLATLVVVGCAPKAKEPAGQSAEAETSYVITTRGPKKRVGVVKFENKATYAKRYRVGQAIVDIVTTELAKTDAFILVERSQLDEVLKEQALGQSGAIDPATAAQAGRVLGLQAMIIGTISEFGVHTEHTDALIAKSKKQVARAVVDVRLVDTTTGEILYAGSGTGEAEDTKGELLGFGAKGGYDQSLGQIALRASVKQFMQSLLDSLVTQEWRGKVVKVDAGRGTAIVNAGKETGLQVGDKLQVNRLGEVLVDPDSGRELGQEIGPEVGELEVISLFGQNVSKCKIVSGRTGIAAGQQVTLKERPAPAKPAAPAAASQS
ncbi:MAG: hypothetical protein KDH09_03630 [Chrysiogenetes bacterium]|nr:hypothetical protein [Chrysiogenetes bacterium]